MRARVFITRTQLVVAIALAVPALLAYTLISKSYAAPGACSLPSKDYGIVTGSVTASSAGTYRVWTRMAAANTSANTYMLEIDQNSCYTIGGSAVPVYAAGATTKFTNNSTNWISKTSAGQQIDISLTAGAHTFKLIGIADGVFIDRIVLTQDTACVPTGLGENCANPPDTTAPVVNVTAPITGSNISANPTTIVAKATDDEAVSKVEFYVDGVLKGTDTTSDGNNNYSLDINPSLLSIGSHTISARAYDTSNNLANSASVSVTVSDKIVPVVSVSAPTNGAVLSGSATMSATATDNVGVSKVEFYVDGVLKGTDTTGSSNTFSISLDSTSLSNGTHSFSVKAYDANNNSTTSATVSASVNNASVPVVDTTPPSVSVSAPTGGATISGSYNVAALASDASGVAKVEFYIDNVLKNTDTTAPYSYTFDTTTVSNGAHTFKAVATDKATTPNQATSSVVSATVNNVVYQTADINKDGAINYLDLSILASQYGKSGATITVARADINSDGTVNFLDLSALASKYGK